MMQRSTSPRARHSLFVVRYATGARYAVLWLVWSFCLHRICLDAAYAQPQQSDDSAKLPAGLIARYWDRSDPRREVWRIEPTLGFVLRSSESPHPRLSSAWSGQWRGQLQLFRAGRYRFSAEVTGHFRLTIAGQIVLDARTDAEHAERVTGREVELAAGAQDFVAEFSKIEGPARLRVFWESPYFSRESLPWLMLTHRLEDETPQLQSSQAQDSGRFLFEELSCVACHQPAADDRMGQGLAKRMGPDLTRIGERASPGWIDRWLENPQDFRAQAAMPRMFSADARGRAERYVVAQYLAFLGGPLPTVTTGPKPDEIRNFRLRGEKLFARVGCAVCHGDSKNPGTVAELKYLGSKTTPARLAQYLQNPLAVDPSGRMPQMGLDSGESRDLAYFLCESIEGASDWALATPSEQETAEIRRLVQELINGAHDPQQVANRPEPERLRWAGERIVVMKGCANCHRIAPGGKALPAEPAKVTLAELRSTEGADQGCVRINGDAVHSNVPRYALTVQQRNRISDFLRNASSGAGTAAPAFAADVALRRFHCLHCHSRAGQGGLTPDLVEKLRQFETAQDAEAIQPPPLTEVAVKLLPSWLRDVLVAGRRARPWMGLRMPQFGEEQVGALPDLLAAADGIEPSDVVHQFPYNPEQVEAGRFLVGSKGFGCISCHDMAGRPNSGTRGPDLATMQQRVRFEWYERWLDDPQRMQPGTRMPTVFQNKTTAIKGVLAGNARAQSNAIWEYLSLGMNLPLPEGLEAPKGLVIKVRDRPRIIRTFMPDAGNRAIAIGFPGDVAFAFDAMAGRLAYGWTGPFLDATPIWQNRGGSPAGVLGQRFWTSPAGCAWEFTRAESAVPDWRKNVEDPALGAALKEGQIFENGARLRFRDYSIDSDGLPVMRYSILIHGNAEERARLDVREQFRPLQRLAGVGVLRSFEISPDGAGTAWLLAGESTSPPRLLGERGEPLDFDSSRELPTAHRRSVLLTNSKGTQLLSLRTAPADCRWSISELEGKWYVALKVVPVESSRVEIAIWVPYRNEPSMLSELMRADD